MSLFISFEGGEGSGKSTQARLLATWLAERGLAVTLVREPGSTPLGQRLRGLLKGAPMSAVTELLLFGAARAELVMTVIRPHLEAGRFVVADRFGDSTVAYQHYGRGLALRTVAAINRVAAQGLKPDITILLDLPPETALWRIMTPGMQLSLEMRGAVEGRPEERGQARFETAPLDFHRRVREGYSALARREPRRWVTVDAARPIETIKQDIRYCVAAQLPPPTGPSKLIELLDLTGLQ